MPELPEFPHSPPEGYSYEICDFKRNVLSIWIHNHMQFSYTQESTVKSIWGFYNIKTKCFHSPINSKTVGDKVSISNTSPYSAMTIKMNPLERVLNEN